MSCLSDCCAPFFKSRRPARGEAWGAQPSQPASQQPPQPVPPQAPGGGDQFRVSSGARPEALPLLTGTQAITPRHPQKTPPHYPLLPDPHAVAPVRRGDGNDEEPQSPPKETKLHGPSVSGTTGTATSSSTSTVDTTSGGDQQNAPRRTVQPISTLRRRAPLKTTPAASRSPAGHDADSKLNPPRFDWQKLQESIPEGSKIYLKHAGKTIGARLDAWIVGTMPDESTVVSASVPLPQKRPELNEFLASEVRHSARDLSGKALEGTTFWRYDIPIYPPKAGTTIARRD